jgi:hypothetical protein
MAAHNGMAFGTHIVFTYGPLGFLGVQQLNYSGTAILAFLFTLAMTTAIFTALVWSLRRAVPLAPAVVVAYVAGAVCVHTQLGPEYVLALVLVVCVSVLNRPDDDPAPDWIWLASGAVLSIFSLIKISLSLGIVVALLVTVACQHRDRLRAIGAVAAGAVVTFGLCWFATGNGVGNLLPFARNSEAVIGGYSAAMSIEDPTRAYVYWYAALVVVVIGLFATASVRGLPRRSKIGIGLVALVILWMLFKEGFVRHDSSHDLIFFTAASVVLAAFVPRRRPGVLVPGILVLTAVTAIVAGGFPSLVARPFVAVRNLTDEVTTLASPGNSAAFIRRDRQSLQAGYAIPHRMVAIMRGHTVDVSPWEATVVLAYPGIRFDPLPVIADYSAYTPSLDQLDADYLSQSDAPRFILRQPETIDFRDPAFEPPATQLAIECRYRQVAGIGLSWQLLERGPDRCGPPVRLRTVTTSASHWVAVPDAAPGEGIAATFRLPTGPSWTLESLLFKPPNAFIQMGYRPGAQDWRFVVATGSDWHVLRAASTLGYYPGWVQPAPTRLRFLIAGQHPQVTVSFYRFSERAVAGGNGQENGTLTTRVRHPGDGARLSGTTVLRATAKDLLPVISLQFIVSGEGHQDASVAVARMTPAGWSAPWHTARVVNGVYSLQSVAVDQSGRTVRSAPVTVTVDNR